MSIERAKEMLEVLSSDFKAAMNSGARYVGDINLRDYKVKFNVSEEDITAYCQTLSLMTPVHPKCVICGGEWSSLEKIAKPINNGHIIDWVDSFEMWCCPEDCSHDTIWYFQDKNGTCSFNYEMWGIGEPSYEIRWNCHCMEPDCYGKNLVLDADSEYKIIAEFNPPLPYTITRQELYKLIQKKFNAKTTLR